MSIQEFKKCQVKKIKLDSEYLKFPRNCSGPQSINTEKNGRNFYNKNTC